MPNCFKNFFKIGNNAAVVIVVAVVVSIVTTTTALNLGQFEKKNF